MKRLIKKFQRILKDAKGFTLLELIIVIAIMGFLVAMIAPRLAGVVGGATRNTDDSNMQRIAQVTSAFSEKNNRLPNEMTNLVIDKGDGTYAAPSFSDNNPETGKEALAKELNDQLPLHIHILSDDEAAELKALGISSVHNLNYSKKVDDKYEGEESPETSMAMVDVEEGVAVMMVGAGFENESWELAMGPNKQILNPELPYRIVVGVGKDSELVKSGQLSNAAVSPGNLSNKDNYLFGNYMVVLPRLKSTVSVEEGPRALEYTEVTATLDGEEKTVDLQEAQTIKDITVVGPEGGIYPTGSAWTVNEVK